MTRFNPFSGFALSFVSILHNWPTLFIYRTKRKWTPAVLAATGCFVRPRTRFLTRSVRLCELSALVSFDAFLYDFFRWRFSRKEKLRKRKLRRKLSQQRENTGLNICVSDSAYGIYLRSESSSQAAYAQTKTVRGDCYLVQVRKTTKKNTVRGLIHRSVTKFKTYVQLRRRGDPFEPPLATAA